MDSGDIVGLRVRIKGEGMWALHLLNPPPPLGSEGSLLEQGSRSFWAQRERVCVCVCVCVSVCSSAYIYQGWLGARTVCLRSDQIFPPHLLPMYLLPPHLHVPLLLPLALFLPITQPVQLPFYCPFLYSTETRCLWRLSDKINLFFFSAAPCVLQPQIHTLEIEGIRMAA